MKYGRYEIIAEAPSRGKGRKIKRYILCQCECGTTKEVRYDSLKAGTIKSCGCLQKEIVRDIGYKNKKHGLKRTRLYNIWGGMKARCYNVNAPKYHRYGQRGISVFKGWESDFMVFREWALGSGYQSNLTIDRINNDGNYEPKNCQWLTVSENSRKGAV